MVYEVARELGMDNRELMNKVSALGIQVRNHMSALDPAEVERVKRTLEKDKAENTVEERIRPTVVRRRTVAFCFFLFGPAFFDLFIDN